MENTITKKEYLVITNVLEGVNVNIKDAQFFIDLIAKIKGITSAMPDEDTQTGQVSEPGS